VNKDQHDRTEATRFTVVIGAKGGIGVSTIALDWARALANQDHRTLLLELAGGDLSYLTGATPAAFSDSIADGSVSVEDAAVEIAPDLDLIASGNTWAVQGPHDTAPIENLFNAASQGPWKECIVDCGNTRLDIAAPLLSACSTLGVVVTDDLACVSRTYALLRRLADVGAAEHLALIFNRLSDAEQAESLRNRLDHITRTFLGATWPLCGVVPEGPPSRRAAAVAAWATATPEADPEIEAEVNQSLINPAFAADNTG
jgi:MinD-like ATPase involved in chromosome partitioning or flagellar assembly